jgi:hypothetical protein
VYWRGRIARSERPHRVNEAIRLIVGQTGVLKGRRRRAVDSTILADAVATQDTITQLVSAIRRVAREVPGAAEQIAQVCTGHDYSKPGKPKIDWDDPAAKDALVSALVSDANAVVAAFRDAKLDEAAACAVALLVLVAGQDVEPAEGSDGTDGRWRIARKVAEDRVISTVDPDARHTRRSPEARRDGYRAHVAADPETGIITDEKLTRAAGTENSDPAVAEEFLAAETGADAAGRADSTADGEIPGGAGEPADGQAAGDNLAWYGDSAYGTGDLRGAIDDAGHAAVIKPMPLQAPVEGGFTVDDFTVDEQAGTVTCPAGHTVTLSRTRIATFGVACRDCPLQARCTTCKTGRKLVLHERDDLLRAARADWAADTGLREDYMAHRPNVERAVAQVATCRGRRLKLRYCGVARNHAWLKRRTAALNLRNLLGYFSRLLRPLSGWSGRRISGSGWPGLSGRRSRAVRAGCTWTCRRGAGRDAGRGGGAGIAVRGGRSGSPPAARAGVGHPGAGSARRGAAAADHHRQGRRLRAGRGAGPRVHRVHRYPVPADVDGQGPAAR